MLGSVLDFASVRGIKIDPSTTCICCGCGEELPVSNAYVDSLDAIAITGARLV